MSTASRLTLVLAVISSFQAHAQVFRASVPATVRVSAAESEGSSVSLRYNEAAAIMLAEDSVFIQGLEIELRVPKAFQGSESSVAWSLYASVAPRPTKDQFDYQAELVATQGLPARVTMRLIVPTAERHGIKGDPYSTVIPTIAGPGRFPLLFKLSPIGKGQSAAMEKAEFRLTVRPVLGDDGGIKVSLQFPEGADPRTGSVFIDDRRVDHLQLVVVRKGPHVVRVHADGFREEVVNVAVEPGRISPVNVSLVSDIPMLSFHAPAGTEVTVDGQPVDPESFAGLAVEPGEHIVFLRLGDYSMTRKVLAQRGKVYAVTLSVELDIKVSP